MAFLLDYHLNFNRLLLLLLALTLSMANAQAQILKNHTMGSIGSSVSLEPGLSYRSVVGQPASINLMVLDKTPISQGFIHPQNLARTKEKSTRNVNMKIFPNPSSAAFQIEANFKAGDRIEVRNILGMVVYSEPIHASVQTKSIDLGICAEGLYTLSVFGVTEHLQTKLIEIIK